MEEQEQVSGARVGHDPHPDSAEFEDITLVCIGLKENPCNKEFIWTANDQAFYRERGFTKPKRCRECAGKRRDFFDKQKAGEVAQ